MGYFNSPATLLRDSLQNVDVDPIQIIEAHEKRIVVLIDGDGAIFLPSLIAEGKQGGYSAASRLTTGIKSYLGPQQFKLLVYVFHNKRGLTATLKHHGYDGAADKFEDFITGFNEAAERFVMVDAGELEEGIDQKLRGELSFIARHDRVPQTFMPTGAESLFRR